MSLLQDPVKSQLFQQAVDEAIEQHRLNGNAIFVSDDYQNVIQIQAEDITPLSEKLKQRQATQTTTT